MIDNQGRCMITDHGAFVLFAGKPHLPSWQHPWCFSFAGMSHETTHLRGCSVPACRNQCGQRALPVQNALPGGMSITHTVHAFCDPVYASGEKQNRRLGFATGAGAAAQDGKLPEGWPQCRAGWGPEHSPLRHRPLRLCECARKVWENPSKRVCNCMCCGVEHAWQPHRACPNPVPCSEAMQRGHATALRAAQAVSAAYVACRVQAEMLDRRPDRAWFRNLLQANGGPLVDLHR